MNGSFGPLPPVNASPHGTTSLLNRAKPLHSGNLGGLGDRLQVVPVPPGEENKAAGHLRHCESGKPVKPPRRPQAAAVKPLKPQRRAEPIPTQVVAGMLSTLQAVQEQDPQIKQALDQRIFELEAKLVSRQNPATPTAKLVAQLAATPDNVDLHPPEKLQVLLLQLEQRVDDMGAGDLARLLKPLHLMPGPISDRLAARALELLPNRLAEPAASADALVALKGSLHLLPREVVKTMRAAVTDHQVALRENIKVLIVNGVVTANLEKAVAAIELAQKAHSALLDTVADPGHVVSPQEKHRAMNMLIKSMSKEQCAPLSWIYRHTGPENPIRTACMKAVRTRSILEFAPSKISKETADALALVEVWELAVSGNLLQGRLAGLAEFFAPGIPFREADEKIRAVWPKGVEPPKGVLNCLELLSTFQELSDKPKMQSHELAILAEKLDDIMSAQKLSGGGFGYLPLLRDAEAIKSLPATKRPAALCALIKPACEEARERLVAGVQEQRKSVARNKELEDKARTQAEQKKLEKLAQVAARTKNSAPALNAGVAASRESPAQAATPQADPLTPAASLP